MSVPLTPINMSAYSVGQSSVVTLDQAKLTQPSSAANSTDKAHLRVFNDSGSHLKVWMDTGDLNEYLPAGGWLTWNIDQTANEFHWTVINVLSNPPVNLMLITYYKQGENVPEIPQLGNSPIGGAVTATGGGLGTADHLENIGNAASSLDIIDIQQAGATGAQIFADNQGNLLIQDYTSSILTTIFRTIADLGAGGVNVLIGDNGRQIQVNGQTHFKGRIWADSEITIVDGNGPGGGGGSSVAANVQIFNNNGRGMEVLPNGGVTGFIGVQVDSSGVNNTGTGFVASAVQLGAYLQSCFTGMKIDGLATGGGIDMSGMLAGSGPSILTGPNPIALQDGAGAFATSNGSVSGTLQLRCPVWGAALKIALITMVNLSTASNVNVTFPSTITNSGVIWSGDLGGSTTFSLMKAGVAQTCRQIVYGAAGVAGTTSAQTVLRTANQYTFLANGADGIQVQTTGGSGINNSIILIGY